MERTIFKRLIEIKLWGTKNALLNGFMLQSNSYLYASYQYLIGSNYSFKHLRKTNRRHKKLLPICIFIIPQWITKTGTDAPWILMQGQQLSKAIYRNKLQFPSRIHNWGRQIFKPFLLLFHFLGKDCSTFLSVTSQTDAGLQFIFLYFKPAFNIEAYFTPSHKPLQVTC